MKTRITLFLLAMAMSAAASAQVNALPPDRHILVYGEAQARAVPDRFKISMAFESVDASPDAARRAVEANVRSVLSNLKAAGVPDREIVATSLQIGPRQRYDEQLREQVFVGTAVTRSLTARFSSQHQLEKFLAVAKTSKGVMISEVTTELSSEPALKQALREEAIASSREKAEVIAKAYKARLAGVYSVSDVAPQFEYGVREGSWPSMYQWSGGKLDRVEVTGTRLSAAEAGVSFQSGYVTFQDRIYTVFLLAD